MRDVSCCLSSISLHAFAVALMTASVMETPEFAVTSGGVSIAGSQAQEIESRFEVNETPHAAVDEPATDAFRVPVNDLSSFLSREKPKPPRLATPQASSRPVTRSPRMLVETLVIPHAGLLERIGADREPPQHAVSPPETETTHDKIPRSRVKPSGERPEPDSASRNRSGESREAAPPETPKDAVKTRSTPKPARKETAHSNPDTTDSRKETSESQSRASPVVEKAADRKAGPPASQATLSADEAPGAKVDRLPRKLTSNASPPYPLDAWQRQQEGVVYLLVRVTVTGRASSVRVYRSSGVPSLDSAAARTVREWKFQPAEAGGKAVSSPVVVPVRFQIRRQ